MTSRIGFPSQGELIQFVYDATGILPRKKDKLNLFDEKEKKRLQKSLSRLATEDGSLTSRFQELTATLSYWLCGSFPNERVALALGDIFFDLFDVYQAVIRDDVSFCTKSESMRRFISQYAVYRLVVSVNKHFLRYNVAADGLIVPDEPFWYLPSIKGENLRWPLGKVMKWAYQLCESSQTQFHYPGKTDFSEDPVLRQNLDSALKWSAGVSLPSWPVLLQNFNTSFEKMNFSDSKKRESIVVALFVARVATFVAQAIQRQYGTEFLSETIEQYKRNADWIVENVHQNKQVVANCLANRCTTPQEIDEIWMVISDDYWRWFSDIAFKGSRTVLHLIGKNDVVADETQVQLSLMVKKYGQFAVYPVVEHAAQQKKYAEPEGLNELLTEGLLLQSSCEASQIEAYLLTLSERGFCALIPWMEPWLRGAQCYRSEDYESAFNYYKTAFEFSKYSAGRFKIDLVNQYVQVSARINHWNDFKKAMEWADYIGINIRGLDALEPTEADFVRHFESIKSHYCC